jgi:hypothetical protein
MQLLSTLLDQPEYIHTAINHFPLIGLLVASAFLVTALLARNRGATIMALVFLGLLALSAWPVFYFGEAGYDRVLSMSDEAGQSYLRLHEDLAERWVWLYYVTAGVAAVGVGLAWKWPKVLVPSALLALVLTAGSFTAGILIAQSGGKIRHREFRVGPPPGESADKN